VQNNFGWPFWYAISYNPNITFDIINKHKKIPWDWCGLSFNKKLWDWHILSTNPNITQILIIWIRVDPISLFSGLFY
jgi:hypothetical protein